MEQLHLLQSAYSRAVSSGDKDEQEKCLEELAKNGILTQVRYQLEKYGQISHQEAFC